MKKLVLVLTMIMVLLIGTGCQSPDPSHKDTLILVSNIAANHLQLEADLAYLDCEEDQIPAEECEDAIEFERWAGIVFKFEQYIKESDDLVIGAEEIDIIADLILEEMGDDANPRVRAYIMDIKEVLKMMIRDQQTRMTMKAIKPK